MKSHGGQWLVRGKRLEFSTPLEEDCSLSLKLFPYVWANALQVVSPREELRSIFQSVCVGKQGDCFPGGLVCGGRSAEYPGQKVPLFAVKLYIFICKLLYTEH